MKIAWSPTHALIAGVLLIAATNAIALLGVAYNRAGEPESQLQLSERELRLPYGGEFESENSGIALDISWRVMDKKAESGEASFYYYSDDPPDWLDKAKLSTLGFDVSKPLDTPAGELHYQKLLPKEAFLVLELNGPAYQFALERAKQRARKAAELYAANPKEQEFKGRLESARRNLEAEERSSSRLFVVDAARDPADLRTRYPDRARYALVRGTVVARITGPTHKPHLAGHVSGLSVATINVPFAYRQTFEPLLRVYRRSETEKPVPPYAATVTYGKRLEPWITAASLTTPP